MARIITKELAIKIAKKLSARKIVKKGAAHDLFEVWYEGEAIALISIRHGSDRDQGHDHIPDDIHVGPSFAKLLGQCPKSHEDWIQMLKTKGILESDEDDDDGTEDSE